MKYKAVIFDLFGTLVYNFSRREYENVLTEMAEILEVPRDDFIQHWFDSFKERVIGELRMPYAMVENACRKLGKDVSVDRIEHAAQVRLNYSQKSLVPKPGAVEVLTKLRTEGFKTGLISDCSSETVIIWDKTPFAPLFDVTVYSCVAGIKKPDPRIYHMALDQLAVSPEDCLYIGDGSSRELTGAQEVGMQPVLIRDPDEAVDAHFVDRQEWDGTVISSLWEVLDLIK